ncbi:MAG: HIT domain-containing protein [Ignavibacteriota bacterium]
MDYLWTPWRYQYVTKAEDAGVCVFCAASQASDDARTLVVHRGVHNFVILNRYPYCSGHVMVVPYKHVATLDELPDEALGELIRLGRDCEKHLRAAYHPDGLNLGINLARVREPGSRDTFTYTCCRDGPATPIS